MLKKQVINISGKINLCFPRYEIIFRRRERFLYIDFSIFTVSKILKENEWFFF